MVILVCVPFDCDSLTLTGHACLVQAWTLSRSCALLLHADPSTRRAEAAY